MIMSTAILTLLEELQQRPLPQWYEDAKFGIFIHWGLFAQPAFAPKLGSIVDSFKQDYDRAVALTPYTEWYANAIKIPGTPSAEFHQSEFNNCAYTDFKQNFVEGLKNWDVDAWAENFAASGAKYVVLVTKHHDGYCLWPSAINNPHELNWYSERDIVGELAQAVRAKGLRFGLYYSGGIDWTFNREPLFTLADFLGSVPADDYPQYATQQVQELIQRYKPDVLWNDISWPTDHPSLIKLFAEYYQQVPEGVVNDRWRHNDIFTRAMRYKLVRRVFDWAAKRYIKKNTDKVEGVMPSVIPHSDFRTPEYMRFDDTQVKKWECTRGMSHSFGFNRNDRDEDYTSADDLLCDFIDAVAKNGNLLLNVGPDINGQIPTPQIERLQHFGQWLKRNGDAIYTTKPWRQAEATTTCGVPVRFTCHGRKVFIILLGATSNCQLTIPKLNLSGSVSLLDGDDHVEMQNVGGDCQLRFGQALPQQVGQVLVVEQA